MENGKTLNTIIRMSIPPGISMLIQCLYNIVDSIYITRFDNLAMEAISLVYPIQNIILAIGVGIGIGINAYAARKLGEGRLSASSNGATLGVILSIFHYLLVLVLGLSLSGIFIESFTSNEVVIAYAKTYINLIIVFSFTTIIQIALEKVLQSDGKMMLPMISLLLGSVINIALDPILIFTLDMGVLGAAVATVVGQLASTLLMIYFIVSKKNRIRISLKGLKPDMMAIKAIYMVGIPSIILTAIPSFMVGAMNYILAPISDSSVASFGIYYKLQYFVYMAVCGISQGTMPMLSYFYGANNKTKFKETANQSIYLSIGLGVIFTILFMAIPGLIISMFYDSGNIEPMILYLRVAAISFTFGSVNYIIASYMQAVGCGFRSLLIALLRQFILILPLAYLLSIKYSELGVYIAIPVAEGITTIIGLIVFIYEYRHRLVKMSDCFIIE